MPLVNLIEVRRIAARREERGVRIGVVTLSSTVAVCLLGYGALFLQSEGLGAEERTLKANVDRLRPLLKQIEFDAAERADLEPRLKTLADAQGLTGRWGRIMEHLATNTPPHAFLTGLRGVWSKPEDPVSITLSGVGLDQADAAEFMMRVQNARDLENVQLRFTQEHTADKTSAIEFEVGADIVDTAAPKPKEKADAAADGEKKA